MQRTLIRIEIASLAIVLFGCGTSSNAPDAGDAQASDVTADVAADVVDAGSDASAFSDPITLSAPGDQGFLPSIAARDGEALVAWHEFDDAGANIRYARVVAGVPDPPRILADPFAPAIRASVATTTNGYVLAYQANDGTRDVVRAVELDAAGNVTSGPDTITAANQTGAMPHVASNGSEEVFAWTDGTSHSFAMRGAGETIAATPVGTTLLAQGLLNFPRVAIDASGNVFISYRDGGVDTSDWDVLVVTRAPGGTFGAPVDVSNSSGLLSDDIALAMEDDGTLDFVWVDQSSQDTSAFEVLHATRSPQGSISQPMLFGRQDTMTWTPTVTAGMMAVWNDGNIGTGAFYFATPTVPPITILAPELGDQAWLARETKGALDLAWSDDQTPKRVRYARRP